MFSQRIMQLKPYTPGEQPQDKKYIKLNTNENPYPPSPMVEKAIREFDVATLKLYPDPESNKLKQAIADFYGKKRENIFVGNGSDEILALAFYAFFDRNNGTLLYPYPSYSFYPVYCNFFNIEKKEIQTRPDFSIDIEDFLAEPNPSGLIFPNPNAPTAMGLAKPKIIELLERFPSDRVVIIDEAYVDFCDLGADDLIDRFENLLIIKTFSKSRSLAGMRLGYAIGSKKLISALNTAKNSFNSYPVDRIAEVAGVAAMNDKAYFQETNQKICKTRDYLANWLNSNGWEALESSANFIFARKPGISGQEIYQRLKDEGILVRYFNLDRINDFVRITIGTDAEIQALIDRLTDFK
ncbi:MAG: histidinol-phosphate transaminase [Spirochaetales bacterium]|nr:histidinol-phosphate transaminase [Spirochaetales bacterium]